MNARFRFWKYPSTSDSERRIESPFSLRDWVRKNRWELVGTKLGVFLSGRGQSVCEVKCNSDVAVARKKRQSYFWPNCVRAFSTWCSGGPAAAAAHTCRSENTPFSISAHTSLCLVCQELWHRILWHRIRPTPFPLSGFGRVGDGGKNLVSCLDFILFAVRMSASSLLFSPGKKCQILFFCFCTKERIFPGSVS